MKVAPDDFFLMTMATAAKSGLVSMIFRQYRCNIPATLVNQSSINISGILKKNCSIKPKTGEENDFTAFQVRVGMGRHGEG